MTKPQQLAPTMGSSHNGFRFLERRFEGLEGYAVGQMTKSRRGKLYINDAGWGPDTGSIEYGYRVSVSKPADLGWGVPICASKANGNRRQGTRCFTQVRALSMEVKPYFLLD